MGRPSDASYVTHLDNASLVRVGKIERDNFMWTIATKIQSSPADFGAGILERGVTFTAHATSVSLLKVWLLVIPIMFVCSRISLWIEHMLVPDLMNGEEWASAS